MSTVSSVMTRDVITTKPETSFKEAVRVLRSRKISGMPVVDSTGLLVGIVTEGDLLNKAEKREPDAYVLESRWHRNDRSRAAALDVASAMTREVACVRDDYTVARAAREMHTRGVKRMPVLDSSGRLVGIVSRGDLLKVFLRTDEELEAEVSEILRVGAVRLGGHGLKAAVDEGVVDLAGRFRSRSRLDAVVRAVVGVDGVVGVRNRMTFDVEDGEFVSLSLAEPRRE
jgi:CBS-domain-containing membrane protein